MLLNDTVNDLQNSMIFDDNLHVTDTRSNVNSLYLFPFYGKKFSCF